MRSAVSETVLQEFKWLTLDFQCFILEKPEHILNTTLLLTCQAFYESGTLYISTDGQNKNFVQTSWSQSCEPILLNGVSKGNGWEDLHIVEEELNLILINIPLSL